MEIDNGEGYIIFSMYFVSLNFTLKSWQNCFMSCIFYHNFKNILKIKGPKCSAEVLSGVPKHKKAVM